MHACMHACIHTYIHTYIHIYIYIYIYIGFKISSFGFAVQGLGFGLGTFFECFGFQAEGFKLWALVLGLGLGFRVLEGLGLV